MKPNVRLPALLMDSLRAHAMMFERPLAPRYGDAVGTRMLLAFLGVGVGVFFALRLAFEAVGLRGRPGTSLAFVLGLLLAFFVAQRVFVRAPLLDIGLRRFSEWTRLERLYAAQVIPLALVIFSLIFRNHLSMLIEQHGLVGFVFFSVLMGLLWGMVQEFLYRGWLQTGLTRRFGAVAGVLVANAAYTFGPLHLNFLLGADGVHWGSLAAIFGIGLIFGILYYRSGNLWLPAVLHGLWPLNMT
ncbi:MAG: type II CAAX endopeptidase family protein [Tahibacter sp.]